MNSLLETSPARSGHISGYADVSEISQSRVDSSDRSPSPFFVKIRETQFVRPNHRTFIQTIIRVAEDIGVLVRIPNPYHHRNHICKVGISFYRDSCDPIVFRIFLRKRLQRRSVYFQILQFLQFYIHVVFQRPDQIFVSCIPGSNRKWYLILVIVCIEVTAQSNKSRHVSVV